MNILKNCIDINLLMNDKHIYAYIHQNNYTDKLLSRNDNKIIKIILQSDNIYYFSYLPIDIKQYIINMICKIIPKIEPPPSYNNFNLMHPLCNNFILTNQSIITFKSFYGLVFDKEYHLINQNGCHAFIITFNEINKSCILVKHKKNLKLIFNNNTLDISPCNVISFNILNNNIYITTMTYDKRYKIGIYILSNNYDLTFQGLYKK